MPVALLTPFSITPSSATRAPFSHGDRNIGRQRRLVRSTFCVNCCPAQPAIRYERSVFDDCPGQAPWGQAQGPKERTFWATPRVGRLWTSPPRDGCRRGECRPSRSGLQEPALATVACPSSTRRPTSRRSAPDGRAQWGKWAGVVTSPTRVIPKMPQICVIFGFYVD